MSASGSSFTAQRIIGIHVTPTVSPAWLGPFIAFYTLCTILWRPSLWKWLRSGSHPLPCPATHECSRIVIGWNGRDRWRWKLHK